MRKIIIGLIMCMLLVAAVLAFSTTKIDAPTAYSTSATVTVNISGGINASGYPRLKGGDVVNVTIMNKSSYTGSYGMHSSHVTNASNASTGHETQFWNYTATLADGDRHWIYLNFTNATMNDKGEWTGTTPIVRVIDVDVDYSKLAMPGYNFSFTTADGTKSYCGVSNANVWECVAG